MIEAAGFHAALDLLWRVAWVVFGVWALVLALVAIQAWEDWTSRKEHDDVR